VTVSTEIRPDRAAPGAPAPLVEARGLVKRFGATAALAGLDFRLEHGEIHALLGRNGAGKSTFIKILAGLHEADEGSVSVLGGSLPTGRSSFAFIHQDLGLVPSLSVADNFGLVAGFDARFGIVRDRRLARETSASLEALGLAVDPATLVADLSVSDRTLVAIARALHLDARAVVLDEPTATLPRADVERLFDVLRALRATGVGVLYVSHRLAEVRAIADRITVLRNGAAASTIRPHEVSESQLAALIMGEELRRFSRRRKAVPREAVLTATRLAAPGLEPVDLHVRSGEVLGCAGLRDAGQVLTGRALHGLVPWTGEVMLVGAPYRATSPAAAVRAGVAYVSGDRVMTAARSLTVAENVFLNPGGGAHREWWLWPRRERTAAGAAIARYGIVAGSSDSPLDSLSGGNAQKVVLARAFESRPRLLVLEEPTAGVDVGARADFYRLIDDACDHGLAVLLASSDAEEVCELSHRVLVFERGRVRDELTGTRVTEENVAAVAMGAER
jgi:ribose transport system ATP-binding protein